MPGHSHRHSSRRLPSNMACIAGLGLSALLCAGAYAQDASSSPVSTPAGTLAARPTTSAAPSTAKRPPISEKQARQADDAYLEGARHIEHNDLAAAEQSFAKAVELNPERQEYVLSLAVTREHRVSELVQSAAKARLMGDDQRAASLLAEAKAIDPKNNIVTQHFDFDTAPQPRVIDSSHLPGGHAGASFGGPIELQPASGTKSFHQHGSAQDVIRAVYSAFGITVTFDDSIASNAQIKFDLDNVNFADATRVLKEMTHVFVVAVQPQAALVAKDTAENRDRLVPQIEETIYMPGVSSEEMTELANVARNVFDLKNVTASPTAGDILIRGDEGTLRLLNATYADLLDGGSDVLLDIHLYEIQKSNTKNVGAQLPTSVGAFPVASEAQNLINQNESLIQEAIAAGLLVLTGNPGKDALSELELLIASGTVNASQFTNLIGVLGHFSGLPLAGVFLGSGTNLNLSLNASDARTLDDIQVRANDNQPVNFRAGTRYPITTSTYSSGGSNSLPSSLAGVNVGGTNLNTLLQQYLGTSTVTIPQIQYEDLGITVKTTPRILRSGDVRLTLELKIEALGTGSNDGIPILTNRSLTSTITVPAGKEALLASEISRDESRSMSGIPGLNEIPGFQGTNEDKEVDSDELLITITPHIVRAGDMRIASKRLAVEHTASAAQ
jgi:general secretion pathway protein D